MLLNCGVGEDSWESLRLQGSSKPILKEISPKYSLEGLMLELKLQYFGHLMWRTDWLEKRHWSWEILKGGGEGDNRGWDCWMASLTWWAWVWASSGSWWRTGKPGMLHSMGSQRVRHDWVTELNWTDLFLRDGYPLVDISVASAFWLLSIVLLRTCIFESMHA